MSVSDYSQIYQDAGQKYGVDPSLLMAQGQVESGGDPNIVSDAGATGIAQLMPSTAKSLGVTDRTDPKQSIDAQARLMAENINRYGDIPTALKAYHGGTDQSNWGPITSAYPAKVLKNYKGTQMAQNDTVQDTPLAAALKAYKDDSGSSPSVVQPSTSNDTPLAAALKAYKDEPENSSSKQSSVSVNEDLLKTLPSAVARGVGIAQQLPPMGVNALTNAMGYSYGKLTGASPELQNKLNNLNPMFTGNTLADALAQAGKAVVTGDAGKQNPISGDVLYNPQTTPGKLLQAGIEGGIAGPAAGGAGIPSALAGVASEGTSEALPNNPLASLLVGGATYKGARFAGNAVTPTPIAADVADVIKGAKQDFGIDTPTSAMTNGNNLVERLASKTDTNNLTGQVNKAAADIMGANDNGEGHTVVNQKSYLDAEKNNSAAYDKVFSNIGDIPIDKQIVPILQEVENSGNTPRLRAVLDTIQSKLNPNGTLPASAYKELTKVGSNGKASVLQQMASSGTETDASIAAQNILSHLETALKDHATPEQQAELNSIDTSYKTMKTMEPIARQVGAGQQAAIPSIQNALNTKFNSINGTQLPPTKLSNYLNTVNPGTKSSGGLGGIKGNPDKGSGLIPTAENVAAIASGHPLIATLPLIQSGLKSGVGRAASAYTNMDWYKNRLLN